MLKLTDQQFANYKTHIPSLLWLWFPLAFAIAFIAIEIFLPQDVKISWYSENGLLEVTHTAIIFIAVLYCLMTIRPALKLADPLVIAWLCIATFGAVYCAGEEVSWGQHIFGWQSSNFWSAINDQGETNLHNTSSWLDQKPRIIVEVGIVISGLIIPALQKWSPQALPTQFRIIYTNAYYVVCAAIFVIFKAVDSGFGAYSASPFYRGSETLEHFMFYYILIYMIDFNKRINHQSSQTLK